MIASAVRVALTAFLIGLTTTTIRAATAPPDLPAPYADPGAYRVLDTQTERYGFGANQVAVTRYKVESLATGKGETVSLDAAGRVLTEAGIQALREAAYPSRIHPDLAAQFAAAAAAAAKGDEPLLPVIVWYRMSRAEQQAIEARGALPQEPDEAHDAGEEVADADDAAARLQRVEARQQEQAAARTLMAAGYVAAADAFVQRAGIPAGRVLNRYQFAPAVAANLTLAECQALEKAGVVNFMFPNPKAELELDVAMPATRAYAGQQARYNGAGVAIAHVEPWGGIVGNNPYLSVAARYQTNFNEHSTCIGGIIRSTHSQYKGMARGCTLISANPSGDTQVSIDPAVDWALTQGATILNASYNLGSSSDGALNWSDMYFDYLVHNNRILFTKSAGNQGDGTGVVTSPGRGFNSFAVGNVQDNGTTAWGNDNMRSSSSYVNPVTGGDKPEIAAYGSDFYSTTTASPWLGNQGSGTSYAAPLVAAIAGLIVDKYSSYVDDPWTLKAMIMASAISHNIEGATRISDYDGAGKALATATRAGSYAGIVYETSFNTNEEYELSWSIPLAAGRTNRIVLSYTHRLTSDSETPDPASYDRCDLDLKLYVGGVFKASSAFTTRNAFEIIDYYTPTAATARVRLINYSWDPDVSYVRFGCAYGSSDLFGTAPDPIEDNYEQNDTRATAVSPGGITEWELTWLENINGLGVMADDDWYRINVTPGFNLVNVDCRFFHADGDIDMQLYNSTGGVEASSGNVTNGEYISTFVAATGGVHYIRVYGFGGARTNTYDLSWDDIQPNVPPAAPTGVAAAPGDSCGIATVSWNPVDGAVGYFIYYDNDDTNNPPFAPSDDGTPANGSYIGNVTSITISNLAVYTDYYFAVVATNAGGTGTYSAVVKQRTGSCEDNYEQNDSRGAAYYPSINWEARWLSSISNYGAQYDSDYFRFDVTPGFEHIRATCRFVRAYGDVTLYLLNSNGATVASSSGAGDEEILDYNLGGGGTYQFLVSGLGDGIRYDIGWDDLFRYVPLPPAPLTGTPGPGIGQMRITWPAVSGATGYKIFYDEDSGNPPYLPDNDGSPVNGANVGNVTSVTVTALSTATYYYASVRTYNASGDSDYAAQIRVRTGAAEDNYEQNDTLGAGVFPGAVTNWNNQWLSDINGQGVQYDSDYFRINVSNGYERIRARITFANAEGNLNLYLYSTNGALIANSASASNDYEEISTVVPNAGGYVLLVTGTSIGNVYDLWWDDQPRIEPPSLVQVVASTNCGQVRLNWSRVTNAISYVVYYDDDSVPAFIPAVDGIPSSGSNVGNVTNVTISRLDGGTIYFFTVTAVDALGQSTYADIESLNVPECPPVMIGIELGAPGFVVVKWLSDTNETYTVQRAEASTGIYTPATAPLSGTPPTNIQAVLKGTTNGVFYQVIKP